MADRPGDDRQRLDPSASEESVALDAAFLEWVDRLNAGEQLDPMELHRRYPLLADQLLAELQAYLRIGEPLGTQITVSRLGDYEIRRELGRGGMGIV